VGDTSFNRSRTIARSAAFASGSSGFMRIRATLDEPMPPVKTGFTSVSALILILILIRSGKRLGLRL
jgi:hypothetical protein